MKYLILIGFLAFSSMCSAQTGAEIDYFPFTFGANGRAPPQKFLKNFVNQLNTICPGNTAPTECKCLATPGETILGPFIFDFITLFTINKCKLGQCSCPGGSIVDVRPQPLVAIMNTCSGRKVLNPKLLCLS